MYDMIKSSMKTQPSSNQDYYANEESMDEIKTKQNQAYGISKKPHSTDSIPEPNMGVGTIEVMRSDSNHDYYSVPTKQNKAYASLN